MEIGIVVGSTRPGRNGRAVAEWVYAQAQSRTAARYSLLDLKDFALGLLDEATIPAAANRQYENPHTTRWSQAVDPLDGFVFVTPEYNHSVPAAMKNAVDLLGPEWTDKAVGFVSYGADGGVRAVEHWRQIMANLRVADARAILALQLFVDFGEDGFQPLDRREKELGVMFDQLEPLTAAMRGLRVG